MSSFSSVKKLKGFYRVTVNSRYCGTSRDCELVSSIKRVLKAGFHWRRSRSLSQSASRLVNIENQSRKARLHVKGGGTARVENECRFQQNLTVYTCKFCKGTDKKMARSSENRGTDKDRLHVVFFETGTDRARDMKLQLLVRMRLRPYLKRQ